MIHAHKGSADAANEDLCVTIKQSELQRAPGPLCICIRLHPPPSASIHLHQPPSLKKPADLRTASLCVCVFRNISSDVCSVESVEDILFVSLQNTFLCVLPGRFLIILHCSDGWLINGPADVPVPASDVKVKSISDCWSEKQGVMQTSR